MQKSVAIIILNWNGGNDTIECLESLFQIDYDNYHVILVDNYSTDNSIEKIKKYCSQEIQVESNFFEYNVENKPINVLECYNEDLNINRGLNLNNSLSEKQLIMIRNNHNDGFSEGNNIAIRFAINHLNPHFFLLLNNDTVVDPNFLGNLVNLADSDNNIGIVGPNVYSYEESSKVTVMGGNVNFKKGLINHPTFNDFKNTNIIELDYISGCSLLIKKDVIEDIGLLDKDYFLYFEDVDWCLRAKKAGYKIVFTINSSIWHKVSATTGKESVISIYYGIRNRYLLFKKNSPSLSVFIIFNYFFIVQNCKFLVSFLLNKNFKNFVLGISAIYDAYFGVYGFKKLK